MVYLPYVILYHAILSYIILSCCLLFFFMSSYLVIENLFGFPYFSLSSLMCVRYSFVLFFPRIVFIFNLSLFKFY